MDDESELERSASADVPCPLDEALAADAEADALLSSAEAYLQGAQLIGGANDAVTCGHDSLKA